MQTITVQVNDQPVDLIHPCTVASLLENLNLRGGPVAVERNMELVPADRHQQITLVDGDRLEVVSLTGGG